MIKRIIAALFGPCVAYGHKYEFIPPTPEEAEQDKRAYQEWFDEYPLGEYPTLHGHRECSVCKRLR